MRQWLHKKVMTYAMGFGLTVSLAKGLLHLFQDGTGQGMPGEMAIYFIIASLLAIPLYYFRQERQRHGVVMDHIILLCLGMVVAGGMLHDQIAVRISKDYYVIGHFPIAGIHDETLLALIWGFLGTWWFGAGLGMILAMVACAGPYSYFPARLIFRISIVPLLVIEMISWLMAGLGYTLTRQGIIGLEATEYATLVAKENHAAFMADWWANGTAYSLLLIGCVLLARYIWQSRKRSGAALSIG